MILILRDLPTLSNLTYTYKRWICVSKNIDGNFIDRYPQYVNYPIDAATKHFIDRFITSLMPDNTNPTMEVVYGG